MRLDAAPTPFRARARMPDVSGAPDGPTGHLFEARCAVRATGLRRTSSRFALLRVFDLAFGHPVTRLPGPLRGRGRGASPPTKRRALGRPHRLRPCRALSLPSLRSQGARSRPGATWRLPPACRLKAPGAAGWTPLPRLRRHPPVR